MFKITSDPKFTHTVKINVPVDGGTRVDTLKVTFREVATEDLTQVEGVEAQRQFLQRVVCDFADLVDDDGAQVPYSDDLRDRLIDVPYVRAALFAAYIPAITGARAGN